MTYTMPTTLYFVRAGVDGPVKIGACANLESRLGYLQQGNHRTLHVIRQLPGGRSEECWLHKYFHEHHLLGEWFSFTPEMLTVVPSADHSTLPNPNARLQTRKKRGLSARGTRTFRGKVQEPKFYDPEYPKRKKP